MANKFVKLGNIRGVPIDQIVRRVGAPSSISSIPDGQLYQWIKASAFFGSYHYAISVGADGNAIGFTHQFSR